MTIVEKEKENVVFVLGSSGPKAHQMFEFEKEVVKEYMNNQTDTDTTYTIVIYGKDSSESRPINEHDKSKRNKLIDSITWSTTGTRLDLGLEKAHKVLKDNKDPKVHKIVYVFVSETASVTSDGVKQAAKKLLDSGSDIITINVNDGIKANNQVIPRSKFAVKTGIFDNPKMLVVLLTFTYRIGKFFWKILQVSITIKK